MNELLTKFKERRIWRVLVAYPSVTFIWLQAVEFFINNYGLDGRLLTASIIIAVVLLPAAVIWNWRHGEIGTQTVTRTETSAYVVFMAAAVACVAYYWANSTSIGPRNELAYEPARSIAVMPFENAGGDESVQFLCDGIAESLINWLATVPDVKVASKSAAFRFRDNIDDTAAIASRLDVDGVVRGRLEKVGEQIVVSVSYVDARDDSQLWGDRQVRPVGEVMYLERSIVDSIKDGLRLEVADTKVASAASEGTDNPQAYEHYLRGHFLIQSTNTEDIYLGLDELRTAISLDPKFALPHADIADALSQIISYGVEHDAALTLEAQSSAFKAVALAPQSAEAQTALATMLQYVTLDWEQAEAAYEAAIALNPRTPVPYHRYADFLSLTLRAGRGQEMARAALATDSLDPSSMHSLGIAMMMGGDFAAAAKVMGDWNQLYPNSRWSYVKHALMLSLDGQCELALAQARTVEDRLNQQPPTLMDSWIAWGYKNCGADADYARSKARIEARQLREPDILHPGYAYLYALEGDTDKLIAHVEQIAAARNPFVLYLKVFSVDYIGLATSDSLPKDPRYLAVLDQFDFPPAD